MNDILFYPFSGFDNVCLQPDLSENPFFGAGKSAGKKDWERKAEIAAQILNIFNLFRSFRAVFSHFTFS